MGRFLGTRLDWLRENLPVRGVYALLGEKHAGEPVSDREATARGDRRAAIAVACRGLAREGGHDRAAGVLIGVLP